MSAFLFYNNHDAQAYNCNTLQAIDIFPALHKYKILHNTDNLKKLCVEIAEFCRAVYASTQNDAERKIYFDMLEKLNKK